MTKDKALKLAKVCIQASLEYKRGNATAVEAVEDIDAMLAQPEEQQSCDKRTWVGLTDEEMWEAVRPLCAANQIATVLVELSKDEYQAIAAKLKEKNT